MSISVCSADLLSSSVNKHHYTTSLTTNRQQAPCPSVCAQQTFSAALSANITIRLSPPTGNRHHVHQCVLSRPSQQLCQQTSLYNISHHQQATGTMSISVCSADLLSSSVSKHHYTTSLTTNRQQAPCPSVCAQQTFSAALSANITIRLSPPTGNRLHVHQCVLSRPSQQLCQQTSLYVSHHQQATGTMSISVCSADLLSSSVSKHHYTSLTTNRQQEGRS